MLSFHITDFPKAYRAWLAREFPGMTVAAQRAANLRRTDSLTRTKRREQRTEQLQYVHRFLEIEAMGPEQYEAWRRAEFRAHMPPLEPFIWDGTKSAAHNVAALRQWELERDQRQWAAA